MELSREEKKALVKRSADALEKLAVGSILVGLFQGVWYGILLGMVFLLASAYLTVREQRL